MENNTKKVITRFAPSPTGFMHVGNLRSALYAYLLAKKNNGTLILRIEDTDKAREVEGAREHIEKVLNWAKITWDEGPDIGGPNAPYVQSERLEIYKKYAQKLIDKGLAYPDPFTEEEVEVLRNKAIEEKRAFLYREHRPENFGIWDGTKPLRFKITNIKSYEWDDLIFGKLSAGPEALDDYILIKSDGYPTYNFCHIVDDIEMGITHVVRGQEYISSTPKFLAMYEALEVKQPVFVSLPHIMGKDGNKKLGKRDGAKDCLEYGNEGYLSEALINYLALLGWHPSDDKELFTLNELIESFEIERVQKSGAQWSDDKLDWINKEHIKLLKEDELEKYVFEWLPKELQIKKIIPIITERIAKFGDIKGMIENGELDFFYKEPVYEKEKLIYKNTDKEIIISNLNKVLEIINMTEEENYNKENLKTLLIEFADTLENRGQVLHPLRFALSGLEKSPDPFILADILGKNETITRLNKAISLLSS
ncbi:MAG: glutamate--tRNA ligase [Candidatus Paceibacterota bacterium]|jgi:glutamyl-tRNA synthetase